MVSASRLLTAAAEDVVQDIGEPYEEYHADLVMTFAKVLRILQDEHGDRAQRREIRVLIDSLAAEMNSKVVIQ
ncbi:MAG: hypothetical protein OXD31_05215 [Chloroflexi bacterium]|nr:hypothetical protein [Chloroflexota bacterium]